MRLALVQRNATSTQCEDGGQEDSAVKQTLVANLESWPAVPPCETRAVKRSPVPFTGEPSLD